MLFVDPEHGGDPRPVQEAAVWLTTLAVCVLSLGTQSPLAQKHFEQGSRLFEQRRLTEAAAEFSEAVRLDPTFAAAWKGLGAAYAAQGNYRDAVDPFQRACELNPKLDDACYYLARALYSLNRFETALEAFERALKVDHRPWRVHNGLGLTLEAMGRADEAERHFREAVRLHRGDGRPDADPRIDLGAFLFRQGRLEEALVPLRAVARDRPSARANFELGRLLFQLGSLEEAKTHLERAVAEDPGHAPTHLLLAKVYFRLGRIEDAERHSRLGEKGLQ